MHKKDQLFYLIHSLSKSEKRYFKLVSGLHKGDKTYLSLFDDIGTMKEVNSPALRKKYVDPEKPGQGLTLKKRYLTQNIMKCLRLYHSEGSVWMIIQNGLNDIEILYKKRLGTQCLDTLTKIRSIAEKYEKFALHIQILDWERKLNYITENTLRSISQITNDERTVINKKINLIELEHLYSIAIGIRRNFGYVKGTDKERLQKEVFAHVIMQSSKECLSQRALFYFYFVHTMANCMSENFSSAYKNSKNLIQLSPEITGYEEYIDGLHEHINICVSMGYYDEAIKQISIVEKFAEKKSDVKHNLMLLRIFFFKAYYLLTCYAYVGDEAKLRKILKWAEKEAETYDSLMGDPVRLLLYSKFRDIHFILNDLNKARYYLNQILNKSKKNIRKDIYAYSLLFNLFYWFEEKEYEVLRYSITSSMRYFKAQNTDGKYTLELAIINELLKCENFSVQKSVAQMFKNIKLFIQQYLNQDKGMRKSHEQYQFYLLYSESKIHNKPFLDVARLLAG